MTAPALVREPDVLDGFLVPREQEATGPPESQGLRRDRVRLMVSGPDWVEHLRFEDLPYQLRPGDLLVVNTSATMPASVVVDGDRVINFSTAFPGGLHLVEPRRIFGASSLPGETSEPGWVDLPGDAGIELLTPYPPGAGPARLWVARLELGRPLPDYLSTWGRPIRYRHTDGPYPLEAYQTVFARVPGSAEMPSAARPFSYNLVISLIGAGVTLAPLVLHTGVSSLETGEDPYPEWYEVPETTAALVNHTRGLGGRVIAVGTTVVRALETTADSARRAHPGKGWTDLVIGPDHRPRLVDGLITGWHEPESTHLDLLEAVAGRRRLEVAYEEALANGYLWHEFGDSHLILPG